jgi:hypothetical protein
MLEERLAKFESVNVRLSQILSGDYSDERRLTLTLAYVNLSLDHHFAIILLMRKKLFGAAMALVRPIFENMMKAHWAVKCATEAEVGKIAEKDSAIFPGMEAMSKAVDKAYSDPGEEPLDFFQQTKKDAWKAMNSYTHSGILQLGRQFNGDRVAATYPEEDLMSGLRASTASVIMLGYLLAKMTSNQNASDQIEELFNFEESS